LAVSEEYEGASPVILHEGEGLRDVPHHKKQDGTASAHGSPRRGGWRRRSFGSVGRGFGGDSLSQGARRGEAGQQVGPHCSGVERGARVGRVHGSGWVAGRSGP
jgi:hypothetical protein